MQIQIQAFWKTAGVNTYVVLFNRESKTRLNPVTHKQLS